MWLGGCLATEWPRSASAARPLQYMEKLSRLAYHPLKMQSCYEKMESLRLDGLQQRFDVSSTSVFKQRAQIHMREVDPRLRPPLHTLPTAFHRPPRPGGVPSALSRHAVATLAWHTLSSSAWNICASAHLANSDSLPRSQLRDPFLQGALLVPPGPFPCFLLP